MKRRTKRREAYLTALRALPEYTGDPLSFVAVLTGAQKIAPEATYYKVEFDLSYGALGPDGSAQSDIELAIKNYMLMMGKDTITEIER